MGKILIKDFINVINIYVLGNLNHSILQRYYLLLGPQTHPKHWGKEKNLIGMVSNHNQTMQSENIGQ